MNFHTSQVMQVLGEAILRKVIPKENFPERAHHGRIMSNLHRVFLNGQKSVCFVCFVLFLMCPWSSLIVCPNCMSLMQLSVP